MHSVSNLVSHTWKPSQSRVLTLDGFVGVPRGTPAGPVVLASWPAKDPNDVLDYVLNIEPAIVGNEGDLIQGVDVTINPSASGDLSLDNTAADGSTVVLWMSGGFAGTTYSVTVRIDLASGRMLQRTMLLPVLALSLPLSSINTLQTSLRDPITDQSGNPIAVS